MTYDPSSASQMNSTEKKLGGSVVEGVDTSYRTTNGYDEVTGLGTPNMPALIQALGANAAIGSVEDVAFLSSAFSGADAVYTMVPPNFAATNWRGWMGRSAVR